MRIAAIQHDIVFEDRDATLAQLEMPVAQAAESGAQLVALTEMFATGFSMRTQLTAESVDGPTATWMHRQAAKHRLVVAGSVPLAPQPSQANGATLPTNTLLLAYPDGNVDRYDKIHPFSYAGEHERFSAGFNAVTVDLFGVRIGLSVCYDLRFSYLYWDRARKVDAELIVANWPASRRDHWLGLLHARAVENQTYVIGVNRIGTGGKLDYLGDSRVFDPSGNVLASASDEPAVLVADLDTEVVSATRSQFPFAADRLR